MSNAVDYEDEQFVEIGVFARKALYYYLMWPKKVTLKYRLGVTIYLICSCAVVYGSIGHLIHNTAIHGFIFSIVADDITVILTTLTFLYLIFGCMPIREDLNHCLKVMGDFSYYRRPISLKIINYRMDQIGKYVLYYIWFCVVGVTLLKSFEKCEPDDYSDCGLLIVAYLPMDIFSSTNRKIFLLLQINSANILGCISHLIGWLLLSIVECTKCYLHELIMMVKEIPVIKDRKERRNHLKKCIEYHQHILQFYGEFSNKISHIVAVHLYATPIIMSVISFQLMAVEFDIKNVAHLSIWFIITTCGCFISERLIKESEDLYLTIFYSIPFDDDVQLSKDMMFMMMRSEKVLAINGLGLINLGHEHLMNIVTTAYTYLSVLASTL